MITRMIITLLALGLLFNGSHAQAICPYGCGNGGTCSIYPGSTNLSYCQCAPGYSGAYCQIAPVVAPTVAPTNAPTVAPTLLFNFCTPNNCANSGPCYTTTDNVQHCV